MTDISTIKGLLDWQLLKGSHAWPDAMGGTCINEAAIVVAGYEYTEVAGVDDLPTSFSRELGMLLLCLNDALDDEDRQKLKRFVLRLPDSRGRADVETNRIASMLAGLNALCAQYRISSIELPVLDAKSEAARVSCAQRLGTVIAVIATPRERSGFLDAALDVIERAFDIGCTTPPIDGALVDHRLERARLQQPG